MRFRRLKLTGFKSFVEPADLRIEPGLTGVVGPNGCGKSNLLEAMRWVMGEGSPKSLRGGGMDDVIFAGTAARAPRDFAEVSLLVETGEGGEREVTRRIERGAGSAYRIDGRDVRQKDVALLFADAATGAHSPALVSQGRISAIIAARPPERRQMLEEAAGIAGLHVRRKDAGGKLKAAEVNLQRLDKLLQDQEARAGALRRQARAAERYRSLSDRIALAEARLLFSRWAEAEEAAGEARAEADRARMQVEELARKLRSAEEAQAAGAVLVAERRRAAICAREEGQELAHRLATSRAALDTARRRLSDIDSQSAQLETERSRERALGEDAAQAIAALSAEQEAIAARLATADQDQESRIRALAKAEEKAREAEAALADLLTREASLAAGRQVAEAARNAARSHAVRLEEEARRLLAQEQALRNGAALVGQRDLARSAASAAAEAIAAADRALAQADEERAAALLVQQEAEVALAEARSAHASAASEARAIERALAGAGQGGVLGSIQVAAGFEKALAAALGDDLGAPLGDGGERGWTGSEPAADDPALAPDLDSLAAHVKAPPELARRLAQVAVVERDAGQPLAVGQRLVTLEGRLRRWDGFVSSGEGAAAAERLERQNRLQSLGRLLPILSSALAEAEQDRESAAFQVGEAQRRADEARAASVAADARLRQASREEDQAVSALERHEQQLAAIAERLADLAPVREAAARAVAEAEEALLALPEPGSLTDALAKARAAAAASGQEVAELRADLATAARILASDRERQMAAVREAAAWGERVRAAGQRVADASKRAEALARERLALAGEPERLEGITATLEQQLQTSSALVSAALAAERDAEVALADLGRALAAANEALAEAREGKAAAAAKAEAQVLRRAEYGRVCGEKFQCPPPLLPGKLGFEAENVSRPGDEGTMLERLVAQRERLGPVNLVAEQELAELDQSRLQGAAEREELGQAINRLRGSIGSLNREGRTRLLEAYAAVDRHFQSLFTTLFEGGQAHLVLTDSDDPLDAGLEIMAQPPGKRLSALSLLSGGEQALTAVALIFALFLTKPSPICVLDEVDAPLDDANVERFCDLLVRMTAETDTRYLIVTHNAVTMSRMHRLYGVTMVERGVSRLVSVDLGAAEQLLAAE